MALMVIILWYAENYLCFIIYTYGVCMLSHISCVWLCDPVSSRLPGSSVHGIFWAKGSGLPFPTRGYLANPVIEPTSLASLALQVSCIAGKFFTNWITMYMYIYVFTCMYYMYQRWQWHPTPVLLPGKSHGQRRLVGCSPWGRWVEHDWATSLLT